MANAGQQCWLNTKAYNRRELFSLQIIEEKFFLYLHKRLTMKPCPTDLRSKENKKANEWVYSELAYMKS